MCPSLLRESRSGFQRLCFEIKNEDSDLKSFKICKSGMLSISIIPNKDVKWIEMAMVSRSLLLTVIAVFWVMGNSVSISSSDIQCPANSRNQCVQSPCCALSIFCCFHSKISPYKVKMLYILPLSLSLSLFPASPEEHVTMVTNPSGAQTKSTFLVRLPSRAKWNQSSQWSYQKSWIPAPFFSVGLTNIRQKDTSLVPQDVQERKFKNVLQQVLPVFISRD